MRLRYRLIWAQARNSAGKIALLVIIYLFFLAIGISIGLFGVTAALAGVGLGRAEAISRGLLSALHIGAVMTSLFFGIGSRAAFSESVLRRYPMTSIQRTLARHLIGLIDPVWFLLGMSTFGLALGFAIVGAGSPFIAFVAAALFIVAAYLTTIIVFELVDRAMRSQLGAAILGTLGLGVLSFSGIGMIWLSNKQHPERLQTLDLVFLYAPSGLTASLMNSPDSMPVAWSLALLVAWCLLMLSMVGSFERRTSSTGSPMAGNAVTVNIDSLYDRVARLAGDLHAPLVGKALRYYLRSNRVRLGLGSTPIFALASTILSTGPTLSGFEFYFTFAIFSFVGFSGPSSISLNWFGSDGDGVRRYAILPVKFVEPVRAGNSAAMVLGALTIPPTMVLWVILTPMEVDWRMLMMLCGSSITGLFVFNGLAMWTTILSPRRSDFTSMLNNRLPLGGNLVIAGGMILVFGFSFLLGLMKMETLLGFWWLSLVAAALGLVFYMLCWHAIEPVARNRRDRIIEAVF